MKAFSFGLDVDEFARGDNSEHREIAFWPIARRASLKPDFGEMPTPSI